jgi:hypothetical protein
MNKSLLVSALLAVALSGCSRDGQLDMNHHIDRSFRIQLLNDNGGVIREWIAAGDIRTEGNIPSGQYFTEKGTGKRFRIGGNMVIEEL